MFICPKRVNQKVDPPPTSNLKAAFRNSTVESPLRLINCRSLKLVKYECYFFLFNRF